MFKYILSIFLYILKTKYSERLYLVKTNFVQVGCDSKKGNHCGFHTYGSKVIDQITVKKIAHKIGVKKQDLNFN